MGAAYQNILFEVDDGIATRDAQPTREAERLHRSRWATRSSTPSRRIRADAGVRVVILTGAGRGFCAGVDLDALKAHQASEARSEPKASEAEARAPPAP